MSATRKQITFDLSQEKLKLFYPRGSSQSENFYKKAYSDIQKFMLKNGFSHRQYSVYVSKKGLSQAEVNMLCDSISRVFPWIGNCINEIDITAIGKNYSLKQRIMQGCNEAQKNISNSEVKETTMNMTVFTAFDEDYEYEEEEPEL